MAEDEHTDAQLQLKVYGEFTPEERQGIEKVRVWCTEVLERSMLTDGVLKVGAYTDFFRDRFSIALSGMWWGRKVGEVCIDTPATWWDACKAELYRRLEPREFELQDDPDTFVPVPTEVQAQVEAEVAKLTVAMRELDVMLVSLESLPPGERQGIVTSLKAVLGGVRIHSRRVKVTALLPGYVPPEATQGAAYVITAQQ